MARSHKEITSRLMTSLFVEKSYFEQAPRRSREVINIEKKRLSASLGDKTGGGGGYIFIRSLTFEKI